MRVKSEACAWCLAAVLIALGIAASHAANWDGSPEFRRRLASADEPESIDRVICALPAPLIATVGNSRPREGLIAPLLCERLRLRKGDVRNYCMSTANAETTCALLRLMEQQRALPRIIIWGVSPRDLGVVGAPSGSFAPATQPTGQCFETREEVDLWTSAVLRRALRLPWVRSLELPANDHIPALGEWTTAQVRCLHMIADGHERSLVTDRVALSFFASAVRKSELGDSMALSPEIKSYAREIMAIASRTKVRLVVVEMPLPKSFLEYYPPGVYDEFLAFFQHLSDQGLCSFHPLSEFGDTWTDRDFVDHTHLNWTGAQKLTDNVAARLQPFLANARPEQEDPTAHR